MKLGCKQLWNNSRWPWFQWWTTCRGHS